MKKKLITIAILLPLMLLIIYASPSFAAEDTDYYSQYDSWFNTWSAEFGIPDGLAKTVATHESGLDPNIIGCTDDLGLMQLNPEYIEYYLELMHWEWEFNWTQPRDNIMLGCFILADNYRQCGDWTIATSAYNTGMRGYKRDGLNLDYLEKVGWEE